MARVFAVVPDLLMGSKVQATLTAAGHEVTLVGEPNLDGLPTADLIVADLEAVQLQAITGGAPVLGFYSHVNVETRRLAEEAGVDLVVPRSRLARELPELVAELLNAQT